MKYVRANEEIITVCVYKWKHQLYIAPSRCEKTTLDLDYHLLVTEAQMKLARLLQTYIRR